MGNMISKKGTIISNGVEYTGGGVSVGLSEDSIADNLTTDDSSKVLSAKQGKLLNDELTEVKDTYLEKTGDASNTTATFTESVERENIVSGEKHSAVLGKIAKWFSDLKSVAFSNSYNDLQDVPTIPEAVSVKGDAESEYRTGEVNITPANIGLDQVDNTPDADKSVKYATSAGTAESATKATQDSDGNIIADTYVKATDMSNVENKSSETIRSEITKSNVTAALKYTPYTPDEVDSAVTTSSQDCLASAKAYTDEKIDAIVGEGASTTLDTIGEISQAIEENQDMLETLNSAIGSKANASDLTDHTSDKTVHITSTERTNWNDADSKKHEHSNKSTLDGITSALVSDWNDAKTHADSTHARTDATKTEKSSTNGNVKINGTETQVYAHPNSGATAGTYRSVTVNAQGHVTAGSNPTLAVNQGGTGATDAATARTNLGLGAAATASTTTSVTSGSSALITSGAVHTALSGKADSSHGNHVPATETADNAKFLRNDNTWQTVTPANIGAAASSHGTHVTYSDTEPLVAGTASAGTAETVSRSDHVHPEQTSVSGNAGTATILETKRAVDGVNFDGSTAITHYVTCSSAANTTAKTVSKTGFVLTTGATIRVKFANANTASTATLNVNGTGAKYMRMGSSSIGSSTIKAGRVYEFVYDGSYWQLVCSSDTNTTYSAMTGATASAAGTAGLVPKPAAGDESKFLKGDGTWAEPSGGTGDLASILLAVYPVGSIYMSATDVNPGTIFGGTWEAWGSGRVPVGVNVDDTDFDEVEKTGGEKKVTLTVGEIPAHTHTFTGTAAKHTHSFSGIAVNTGTQSANHTHSVTAKGSISGGGHAHNADNDVFLTTDNSSGAINRIRRDESAQSSGSTYYLAFTTASGSGVARKTATKSATPSMTFTGTAVTSGANSANHVHSVTANGNNAETSITPAGTNSNTGGDGAHSNLQPYITCYMWKRTA